MLIDAQNTVVEFLYANAEEHAGRSEGLFVAYPPDPEYSSQQLYRPGADNSDPSRVVTVGNPIKDPIVAHSLAAAVEPTYADMRKLADQDSSIAEALAAIKEELRENEQKKDRDVFLGLGHNALMDTAFIAQYVSTKLWEMDVAHRSGIIVSKAMDFMGINPSGLGLTDKQTDEFAARYGICVREDRTIHILEFLKLGFDVTYRSIPDTATTATVREESSDEVDKHNKGMFRQLLLAQRIAPRLVLAVAMSGTLTKNLDTAAYLQSREHSGYQSIPEIGEITPGEVIEVAGKFAPGTLALMRNKACFAGGSGVREDGTTQLKIDKEAVDVTNPEQFDMFARRFMGLMSTLTDNRLVHDLTGELPVTRK